MRHLPQPPNSGSSLSLEQLVKAEALRLGFTLVGVTSLTKPPTFEKFIHWVNQGHHGSMTYLEREDTMRKREDPRVLLAEAKSVIVLGLPYPKSLPKDSTAEPLSGKVASYAWGLDYHQVIPKLHDELMTVLQDNIGETIHWKGFSDSAPLLERDFGVRAGLGWIGKNGCLISPQQGSTFILSEIFCALELNSSSSTVDDRCGTCRQCIDACPTRCIQHDRTIDATRCISYLTIEHKGEFAENQAALVGDWAFGCDICQAVCPWNLRFADPEGSPHLQTETKRNTVHINELVDISEAEFKVNFRDSPLLRPKLSGMLRNLRANIQNKKR
ncbi:MAG TPA: tRNA epoxyqueuosine(34) reductase QueG [Bellilinea sp.]|nr:tRNA epoxyqueuosine(34) reductase QueG [Bellilinea sp.]